MALKLITAPTLAAVTLAEAKAHCRVDTTDDDTLITAMITSATAAAEQILGRALLTQTWEITLDAFPEAVELTRVPAQSVTSITYVDTAGATQTLDSSAYSLDASDDYGFAYVVPAYDTEWPDTRDEINAVKVRYVAGYAAAADIPQAIKHWILIRVATMYDDRAEYAAAGRDVKVASLPFVDGLLDAYKVWAA